MTREQEILARALNGVDDRFIEAAHAPHKKLRHYTPALIAACLCVVIVATFPLLREMVNLDNKGNDMAIPNSPAENNTAADNWYLGDPAPEMPDPTLGDTVTLAGCEITLTDLTDTTATLTIVKADTQFLYAAIRQYAGGILASTEPDYRDDGTILRHHQIKVSVDGVHQPADTLPIPYGNYTVELDFSSLRHGTYRMEDFLIFYTYAGDGTVEYVRFNIRMPSESVSESEQTTVTTID